LIRVRLAPSVFKGGNIGGFAKIGRARVLGWDQVTRIHQNSVRYGIVVMAGMVVRIWVLGIIAGKGVDPGAGTDLVLITIQV
jgi:hypothetical protein